MLPELARPPLRWGLSALFRMRNSAMAMRVYRMLPERLRKAVGTRLWQSRFRGVRFPRLPASGAAEHILPLGYAGASDPHPGLNIFGYFSGQFGLGETARLYAKALADSGAPVSIIDLDLSTPHHRMRSASQPPRAIQAPHDVDLIIVNPDYLERALPIVDAISEPGRYRIACWFWELEQVPEQWLWALDVIDEVLVASTFVEDAFRLVTYKPITRVPIPLPAREDSGLTRAAFGLPEDAFIFLTSFDFHSSINRKNPYAAISAFRRAFPDKSQNVRLLIKSSNGDRYPVLLEDLVTLASVDARMIVRDEVIDGAHLRSLERCADAYVSLHRAEGFGLGMAECMAIGKPVVATAWSGNMDFMTEDNSCLVPYRLIPVADGHYPWASGARWAEPDIDKAAAFMQMLVLDQNYAGSVGARAAADMQRLLSPSASAARIVERLHELAFARAARSGAKADQC